MEQDNTGEVPCQLVNPNSILFSPVIHGLMITHFYPRTNSSQLKRAGCKENRGQACDSAILNRWFRNHSTTQRRRVTENRKSQARPQSPLLLNRIFPVRRLLKYNPHTALCLSTWRKAHSDRHLPTGGSPFGVAIALPKGRPIGCKPTRQPINAALPIE